VQRETDAQRSLKSNIAHYLNKFKQIENHLSARPEEWGKFQAEFNEELDNLFKTILEFEQSATNEVENKKVEKVKDFFIKRFRHYFKVGEYCSWSIEKPYGYAGDFKIIDLIYKNCPESTGVERLYDNYFLESTISRSVRSRKEDFKDIITTCIAESEKPVRVMNMACGSCREIFELLEEGIIGDDVTFDCYDHDRRALDFAKKLFPKTTKVKFFQKNALRLATGKNVEQELSASYDMIFSMGLFDYLTDKTASRLIEALRKVLKNGGKLCISNVEEKYSNPSVHFMEWAGGWNLVYRSQEEFRQLFTEAGFEEGEIEQKKGQYGIMQYIIATNNVQNMSGYR